MERKKKIQTEAGEFDVTELGFRTNGEFWNEYLADDGSVIRVKLVVTEISRVDGQYDDQGNPAYIVRSMNVTAVSAPEELRERP